MSDNDFDFQRVLETRFGERLLALEAKKPLNARLVMCVYRFCLLETAIDQMTDGINKLFPPSVATAILSVPPKPLQWQDLMNAPVVPDEDEGEGSEGGINEDDTGNDYRD